MGLKMKKSKKERYINWLKNGQVEKFNRYRKLLYKYDVYVIDLENANLEYAKMENANLENANMINANLYNSNMANSNLENVDMYNANMKKANLKNANINKADLTGTHINNIQGKHIFKMSGNGSAGREIWYILEDDYIQAGCWGGTLDEFEKRVEEVYGNDKDSYEYKSYQDVIEYYRKKRFEKYERFEPKWIDEIKY